VEIHHQLFKERCHEVGKLLMRSKRTYYSFGKDSNVLFCTDNKTAKANIVKGSCRDQQLLPWVVELHVYSVLYNFEIGAFLG